MSSLGRWPSRGFASIAPYAAAKSALLSPASGYMTGHLLPVDGGWLAG
jgi:NAD(P)-dependent dehydrogenase (short-subunit alcohol dehydrogenase family)